MIYFACNESRIYESIGKPILKKFEMHLYIVRKYLYFEQMLLFLTLYSSKNEISHDPKNQESFNTHKSAYYYDF